MKYYSLFAAAILPILGAGCTGAGSAYSTATCQGDTVTNAARLLTLIDYPSCSVAEIRNPWDTTKIMATYVLVPDSLATDSIATLPEGTIIRTPLQRSLIYSGVHGGAICELDQVSRIAGVTDGQYFTLPEISEAISRQQIKDVGSAMSPSIEAIVELAPDAILTAPYQNSGHGAIETLQIPIVEMADYMEATPLGRAEWIKLIGRLYGRAEASDSIYNAVSSQYHNLCKTASATATRPLILTEMPYNGVWSLPGGNSYAAKIIRDAGGTYPWANDSSSGSIELDPAAVLNRCENADLWLIRSYAPLTLQQLKSDIPLASRFTPYNNKRVYVCNTACTPIFEEVPFHPERLLSEYISLFHPELNTGPLHYYKPIN